MCKSMHKPKIAFTCDDISPTTKAEKLRELLSTIDRFDITATFFVIPKSHSEWSSRSSIATLLNHAQASGHEIALHGLSHYPFETWNPLGPLSPCYSAIREKISMGLQIFNEKLEITPKGFRAPYHQINRSLLQALNDLDFLYDSSKMALTKILLSYVPPLRAIWFSRRHGLTASKMFHPMNLKLLEIPITHEFTWHNLKCEVNCFQAFLQNSVSQMETGYIVIDSHIDALSKWGLQILKELFLCIKENGLDSLTLQQITEEHARLGTTEAYYIQASGKQLC